MILALTVAVSPLLLLAAFLFDLVTRRWRWPTVRMLVLVVGYLALEAGGLVAAVVARLAPPYGRRGFEDRNHRIERWLVGGLASLGHAVAGLRFEVDDTEAELSTGPMVALSRHVSIADALLPAIVLGLGHRLRLRFVLARGLQVDPVLDVVLHRLPNHFVDRGTHGDASELDAIRRLGGGLADDEVAVIFPEGALYRPERRDRALVKLREQGSPLAERAAELDNVLPPRPAGTLALLDGAPDADVAVMAHVGFEPIASVLSLWRALPLEEPVRVKVWRCRRAEVPDGEAERTTWLYDRWAAVDDWIGNQRSPV